MTKRARVYGIVQGVGFRPTVARHATAHGVCGSVCNKGPYVEIYVQGPEERVEAFLQAVLRQPPERSVILKMDQEDLPEEDCLVWEDFSIIESEKIRGDIFVSPDIAICPVCKKEMYDPANRRYLHPFINCTCCGPRLTILDSMPYDRVRTSMAAFPMCQACAAEYDDPQSRRYDAQPVACHDCGPQVYLLGEEERGEAAIRRIRRAILEGEIVAIKGIGGFHLCCDATNSQAVETLRQRKRRPAKPFAVMMRDMDRVRQECYLLPSQEEILDGHQKPILLLDRKEGGQVCQAVAPANPKLGVMLPYAPIHLLLFDYPDGLTMPDCLVMTSANTSGAPICRDDEDAARELSQLCDHILSHDRLIRLRADDTVMDFYQEKPYMIRRSRGYAPLPCAITLPWEGEVLAIGGELKNTFCLSKNQLFYPSPYLGDMGDLRTVRALEESVRRMEELLEARPQIVACDLHPGYNTSAYARTLGLPLIEVQHHYAHILSCMVENDLAEKVIGVAYDGTGYGSDGSIWGGEILLADYEGYERVASVVPFDQVGGDASSREGWRIAVSLLKDCYGEEEAARLAEKLQLCPAGMARLICRMAAQGMNSVRSTSAGRLFDAVSAILGICRQSSYEGQASCALQYAAMRALDRKQKSEAADYGPAEEYAKSIEARQAMPDRIYNPQEFSWEKKEGRWLLPTDALVRHVTDCLLEYDSAEESAEELAEDLALYFHQTLAQLTVQACVRVRQESGIRAVALSGGVYQNTLLVEETLRGLEAEGFRVYTHSMIPPNDGGICLGQAAAAMYRLQSSRDKKKTS